MKTLRRFTGNRLSYLRIPAAVTLIAAAVVIGGIASAFNPDPERRLTNDDGTNGGYISDYTLVTGNNYTDPGLTACSQSHGRQNEPAVAVDPRDPRVIVGSSNDYCPVFNADGTFLGLGDVWLGYYRSEDGGASFISSLVPGYQGDTSLYAARSHVRTADSGDPVLAWDNHGRLFAGSESSTNPEKPTQTSGDVWVATYENPAGSGGAIAYNASTDCGASFSRPHQVLTFEPYDPTDLDDSGAVVGECGDFALHCQSGYTFMRGGTQVRSTADQTDATHDYLYVLYDPSIPGTEVASGTTYGSIVSEDLPDKYHQNVGSQSGIYFFQLDAATGAHTAPTRIDPQANGLH